MLLEFRMGLPRARRRNRLVLFDRFIHDLLVDPRRYRMERTRLWMRAALALAPRPDLAIIVTAAPEVIQRRKQEVLPTETARQVAAYLDAARLFPRALVVENVGAPEAAAERILAETLGPMSDVAPGLRSPIWGSTPFRCSVIRRQREPRRWPSAPSRGPVRPAGCWRRAFAGPGT